MQMRLIAVAVALALVALPSGAQRVGAHASLASHGGGFSAPAFHGSFAGPSRSSFMPSPQFGGSRFGSSRQFSGRITAPSNFNRGDNRAASDHFRGIDRDRDQRFRRAYNPIYGVGLPYSVGWIGPDYFSYSNSAFYDSPANATPQPQPADYQSAPPTQYEAPPVEQAAADSGYRPAYQRPQPEAPLPAQDAVTLIFKDGRPSEQIYNYFLTRSTLYVQEQHLREIPVEQLDLAAMAKVNGDAGVDFKLPALAQ